jgi:hypothetical protein
MPVKKTAADAIKNVGKYVSTFGFAKEGYNPAPKKQIKKSVTVNKKELFPIPKKKTGMDAMKAVGKYVSTFGGATERDNPKQKDINIVKKIKETGTLVKNKLKK